MQDLQLYLSMIIKLFKMPITVYGFTFSYFDILIFTVLVGLAGSFFGGILGND